MTPEARAALISKVIGEVAASYCARVWWADKLDLMQEAWAVVLAALQRKEVPDEWLPGTVYRIASRRMSQYLWELSAPVTGARGSKRLAGLHRSTPDRPILGTDGSQYLRPDLDQLAPDSTAPDYPSTQAEATAGLEVAREELFWRVAELYQEALHRLGKPARGLLFEAVLRVLLDGGSSTAAAAELGADLREVYTETALVKQLIVDDGTAQELLEEIEDWRRTVIEE